MTTGYEHGGPFLGSGDPTGTTAQYPRRYEQLRYLREAGIEVDEAFRQNIDNVVSECTKQLAIAEGRDAYDEKVRECDSWLSDVTKAHLDIPQTMRLGGLEWMDVLGVRVPDADWLAYITEVPVVVKDAYELCVETPECRFDLRPIVGETIRGYLEYRLLRVAAMVATGVIKEYSLGQAIWNARAVYYLHQAFKNIAFTGADIWDAYRGARTTTDSSESYRAPREWEGYEEGSMPYNRRTGQWYPARRYGRGSYRGGYRRGGYSRGYTPRRRRTYRRW